MMKSNLLGKRVRLKRGDVVGRIVSVFSHENKSCYSVRTPEGGVQDATPEDLLIITKKQYKRALNGPPKASEADVKKPNRDKDAEKNGKKKKNKQHAGN